MPDAIQTLITRLQQNKIALDGRSEPIKVPSEDFIAALQEIESGLSPVTNNQNANTVYAGPGSGSPAIPAFRALVGADLPNPTATTKGGVESFATISDEWLTGISTGGVPQASQIFGFNLQDVLGPLAWTPADASGAGLAFVSVQVSGISLVGQVFVFGRLVYPLTVSSAPAAISGLPFPIFNIGYADGNIGTVIQNNDPGLFPLINGTPNTSTFSLVKGDTTPITNAQLSQAQIKFFYSYAQANA